MIFFLNFCFKTFKEHTLTIFCNPKDLSLKTSVVCLKNWMKLIYPKLLLLEISLLTASHENGRKFIAIHKLKQKKMLEMYKTNV